MGYTVLEFSRAAGERRAAVQSGAAEIVDRDKRDEEVDL